MVKEISLEEMSKFRKLAMLMVPPIGTLFAFYNLTLRNLFYDQMLETWGITNTQLGLLYSVNGIVAFFCYFVGGFLADRFRMKILIPISVIGMGACFIWLGGTDSFSALMANFVVQAIVGCAVFWGARFKITRMSSTEEEYPKNLAFTYLGLSILGAVVGLIVTALMARNISFGQCTKIIGAAGIVIGVGLYFLIPCFKGELKEKTEKTEEKSTEKKDKGLLYCLKQPAMWITVLMMTFSYAISGFSYIYTPLASAAGLGVTAVALIANVRTYLIGWLSNPIAGIVQDKQKTCIKFNLITSIITTASLVGIAIFNVAPKTIVITVILTLVMSFFIKPIYSLSTGMLSEFSMPTEYFGTVSGIASAIAFSLDAFFPTIIGNIMDKQGDNAYRTITIIFIVCGVGMILTTLWAKAEKAKELKITE